MCNIYIFVLALKQHRNSFLSPDLGLKNSYNRRKGLAEQFLSQHFKAVILAKRSSYTIKLEPQMSTSAIVVGHFYATMLVYTGIL